MKLPFVAMTLLIATTSFTLTTSLHALKKESTPLPQSLFNEKITTPPTSTALQERSPSFMRQLLAGKSFKKIREEKSAQQSKISYGPWKSTFA